MSRLLACRPTNERHGIPLCKFFGITNFVIQLRVAQPKEEREIVTSPNTRRSQLGYIHIVLTTSALQSQTSAGSSTKKSFSCEEEIAYIALHLHQLIRICFEGFPTLLNVPRRFPALPGVAVPALGCSFGKRRLLPSAARSSPWWEPISGTLLIQHLLEFKRVSGTSKPVSVSRGGERSERKLMCVSPRVMICSELL